MYNYFSKLTATGTKTALLLAVTTTLTGCGIDQLAADDQYVPAPHYERYPIKVAKAPIKLEVSSKYGSLQPSQINAIVGFARSANNASASKIAIRRPSQGGASRQVASQTYQLLLQSGISPSMIVQGSYPGPAKGPVQLSYLSTVAVTKECGDWSDSAADTGSNEPSANFGCSVQNNIAAMVVDPQDFEVPKPVTPALASMRTQPAAAPTTSTTAASTTTTTP
jgi:pilus assembly protein CpaD